jgi:hypothetical protein
MSDEIQVTAENAPTGQGVIEAPDPALTLERARLAGSAQCLNCGTNLQGPFCHYCGQPDRNFLRFFPALLREFMEEFLDLDSRFVRTMKPLLFKPGRLTRDYLEGRRFRYTPPLRLYLFSSIGFFLLAAVISSNAIDVGMSVDPRTGEPHLNISAGEESRQLTPGERQTVEKALEDANVDLPEELLQQLEQGDVDRGTPDLAATFTADKIMVDGKPWNRETNPVQISFMPDFVNDLINQEIESSPAKARRINENPNIIIDQLFDILPGTMFVLLPVVAWLLKFWYAFARRYYIEHLIYALHNHSFIFVSAILILLSNVCRLWAEARGTAWLVETAEWAMIVIATWIPIYLLISLRTVYRQGWVMTFAKFSVIGVSYLTLLTLVSSIVAILGFILL